MLVTDILKAKGSADVMTVRADETALCVAKRLRSERVGAMVVSSDGNALEGIISERDVAYGLAAHGSSLHSVTVAELMTTPVITCSSKDTIAEVMGIMSQRRVRHLPVRDGEKLVGVISIGDVLKFRLSEMELEKNVLRDYAIARR
jgi:CBS domain-containing protein